MKIELKGIGQIGKWTDNEIHERTECLAKETYAVFLKV